MLTIGDFARVTHLSRKALRHYQEVGLLEPEHVDPRTGYRYYSTAQIPTAQVIVRFRELGMPVPEVRAVLLAPPAERHAIIAAHLARLEEQLASTRAAVSALRRLLEPAPLAVETRAVPARVVAGVRGSVDREDVLAWYSGAMAELTALGLEETGPPGGLWDDELFSEGHGAVMAYLTVVDPPTVGRVAPVEVPAADLVLAVHVGAHDDIDVTYGQLGRWVSEQGLTVSGPVHEAYLVGPRDSADPSLWRTEIGWPVSASRLAARSDLSSADLGG